VHIIIDMLVLSLIDTGTLFVFRQAATLTVEDGVVLEFKPGRGIYAAGKTNISSDCIGGNNYLYQ